MDRPIALLKNSRLHRQRKGRRKTVEVLNREELAEYFDVARDQVKTALIAADWSFHEDAVGGLWASAQEDPASPGTRSEEGEQPT